MGELVANLLLQLGHVFKALSASMVYRIDSGFTEYGMEDDLKEAEGINLFVDRKKNANRLHHPSVDFLINHHLKPMETTFSEITALFLKKIHVVTDWGFILKVILTHTLTKAFI